MKQYEYQFNCKLVESKIGDILIGNVFYDRQGDIKFTRYVIKAIEGSEVLLNSLDSGESVLLKTDEDFFKWFSKPIENNINREYIGRIDVDGNRIYNGDIIMRMDDCFREEVVCVVKFEVDEYIIEDIATKYKYSFCKSEVFDYGNSKTPINYTYTIIGNIEDNAYLLTEIYKLRTMLKNRNIEFLNAGSTIITLHGYLIVKQVADERDLLELGIKNTYYDFDTNEIKGMDGIKYSYKLKAEEVLAKIKSWRGQYKWK